MRKTLIAGNWKMNKTIQETSVLIDEIKTKLPENPKADVLVCPPFVCLQAARQAISGSPLKLGAQNMYWEDSGAFTGEVSADMLLSAGAEYVIIGHSERRRYFGETDQTVNLKLKQALVKGLKPIVCVGETLEQRQAGETLTVLARQLEGCLDGISPDRMKGVILAYEPVWAIGTGLAASKEQAQEAHSYIRSRLSQMFDAGTADSVLIQYGGSVTPANARELLEQSHVDGALVGGASLKAEDFVGIIAAC